MAPNKEWMQVDDRLDEAYLNGVQKFLDYAFRRVEEMDEIPCPCVKCCNTNSGTRKTVESHLQVYGIVRNYTFWYHHGEVLGEPQSEYEDEDDNDVEDYESEDEIREILNDLYPNFDRGTTNDGGDDFLEEEPNIEAKKFYGLLRDFEQPLYQSSKASKLSSLIKLLHIKSIGHWSNESFTMLLKMLKDELLPDGANLPGSYYEAKKVIRDLGLSYQKIDACKNDCMLYWKEDKLLDSCKVCGVSRWKVDKHSGETSRKNGKNIACKTLRYFPLKPRLQRLFMSTKTSSLMVWHHDKRVDDGIMRHPADSMAWKSFDELHPSFAAEPRNVRLGLASDGFQPFRNSKTSYSIWPVVLIPYNLPPWLCMKQENFIMSMLIPGPDSPGDAIDTYLQPLIEELKELWEIGVETFDALSKQNFKLHASLLWTINDFPAYGNLSGWSTKGKLACPCCNKDTHSIRLANSKKQCFMGHRRYLPLNHKWRNDEKSFDGTKERRLEQPIVRKLEPTTDKFESDDMDIHREHIFKWMKQLWDRWRGNLHAKYVRGKSIQEALRNMPTGIDKKQWEWLVKNHFFTESFQARSTRNRKNRSKLKMPHHIGSKPIREIIYQKGGKDGNPPDLATIFFETRKKNEKLIDSESIEKHAQLQELVQSEPSLSSIEIVEKCFGPQNCSHVFGFGGGVKAKDLKGGMPSKSELMSELRSTREENQSLKDRLSTVENDLKGLMQLKELLLAQLHLFQETNYLLMNIPGFGD